MEPSCDKEKGQTCDMDQRRTSDPGRPIEVAREWESRPPSRPSSRPSSPVFDLTPSPDLIRNPMFIRQNQLIYSMHNVQPFLLYCINLTKDISRNYLITFQKTATTSASSKC